jgi:hypothetical protein
MRGRVLKLLAAAITVTVLFAIASIEICACGPKYPLWQRVIRVAAHQLGYDLNLPPRDP